MKRTKRLLEGCSPPYSFSFNVSKGTEILRTCAVDVFNEKADHYTSLEIFVPQWLDEIAEQTVIETLDLVDPLLDLDGSAVEQVLRRTLQPHLEAKQAGAAEPSDGENNEALRLMALVEEWRKTAGADGGKLTQEQVADQMGLSRAAYSSAKGGKPRAKDHLGRIREFARKHNLIATK